MIACENESMSSPDILSLLICHKRSLAGADDDIKQSWNDIKRGDRSSVD